MKNFYLLTFTLLFIQITTHSQSCLPEGIIFSTQEEIDNFQINYPNCTEIEGDVLIDSAEDSDILNLNGLIVITNIGGSFSIIGNYSLQSLIGLENLYHIGGDLIIGEYDSFGFGIYGNPLLSNLSGLDNLTSIGGSLKIISNHQLYNLQGLDGLVSIEGNLVIGYSWAFGGSCGCTECWARQSSRC